MSTSDSEEFLLTFWEVLFTFPIAAMRLFETESILLMVCPMEFMVFWITVLFFTTSTAPMGFPALSYMPAFETSE
jgi:hypothetical protein